MFDAQTAKIAAIKFHQKVIDKTYDNIADAANDGGFNARSPELDGRQATAVHQLLLEKGFRATMEPRQNATKWYISISW